MLLLSSRIFSIEAWIPSPLKNIGDKDKNREDDRERSYGHDTGGQGLSSPFFVALHHLMVRLLGRIRCGPTPTHAMAEIAR